MGGTFNGEGIVVAGVPVGRSQRPAPGVALSGAHQGWATEVSEGRWVCWGGAQNAVPAQRPFEPIIVTFGKCTQARWRVAPSPTCSNPNPAHLVGDILLMCWRQSPCGCMATNGKRASAGSIYI